MSFELAQKIVKLLEGYEFNTVRTAIQMADLEIKRAQEQRFYEAYEKNENKRRGQ